MAGPPAAKQPIQRRKRSKLACMTCRDLKRRCDGSHPCGTCVRFEYECTYHTNKTRKATKWSSDVPDQPNVSRHIIKEAESPVAQSAPAPTTSSTQARMLEANSGSAFFRNLARKLDPKRNPRKHTFAWNAFLGSRQDNFIPTARPITHILSQAQMRELAVVYFEKIDPTYGFIDKNAILQQIQHRWTTAYDQSLDDAVLCGIAALGCLYSQVEASQVEIDLIESAKLLLEQSVYLSPSAVGVTAWLLRVVYLRVAGTHYAAWMASCTVMHMIEGAGLNIERADESTFVNDHLDVDNERRRRLMAVALHLNIWMSFDMGLTRVTLPNSPMAMPSVRDGDFTRELMELLPLSVELDPERKPSIADLQFALDTVLARTHSCPSSTLAQCNLTLCLCRRLRSMEAPLTDIILEQVLKITSKGVQAAQTMLDVRTPWHHMAYVPFQIVCVLLAIDTVSSISQLRDAMQCLKNISAVYNTRAVQEALKTARSLVLLHQRGKEMFASALNDILNECQDIPGPDLSATIPQRKLGEEQETPEPKIDELWNFDIDQFLSPEFFWNAGINTM